MSVTPSKKAQSLKQSVSVEVLDDFEEVKIEDTNPKTKEVCVFLWLEYVSDHYNECLGHQSYTYATEDDIIIAYNYSNIDLDWYNYMLNMNNLSPLQFYWLNTFKDKFDVLPQDLLNNNFELKQISLIIRNILMRHNKNNIKIVFKPFQQNEIVNNILKSIKTMTCLDLNLRLNTKLMSVFIDNNEWVKIWGNKSCIHRYLSNLDKKSLFEEYGVYNIKDLSESVGYICVNKDEILLAYDKVTDAIGHPNIVIKDCYGEGGDNITFWKSKEDIIKNFVWKKTFTRVIVNEDLRHINKNSDVKNNTIEKTDWVGCSFYNGKVIPVACDQIITNNKDYDGSRRYPNETVSKRLVAITEGVLQCIKGKFMGGFDYCIQFFKNKSITPKIFLVDMNTGRYTAPTQSLIMMQKYNMEKKFFIRKNIKIRSNAKFINFQTSYKKLLFDKNTKKGIYFHCFYPRTNNCVASMFADNENECNLLWEYFKNIKSIVAE